MTTRQEEFTGMMAIVVCFRDPREVPMCFRVSMERFSRACNFVARQLGLWEER